MKKILLLLVLAMSAVCTVSAEWKTDDKAYNIVGQDSIYGQSGLKTVVTPNGNTALVWMNVPEDMMYYDPAFGFYLYMQIYDKDGNPLLGKEGKIISDKHTDTWYTDYDVKLAGNGDILVAYYDMRNETDNSHIYLYRYNQQGEPVWATDGISIPAVNSVVSGSENIPQLCVSGDKIYLSFYHGEIYMEKATEDNWEPSPWFPDEEMPDSVQVSTGNYQIQSINADGTMAWDKNMIIDRGNVWMQPAADGKFYLICESEDESGLDARLLDTDGKDIWPEPVVIDDGPLSGGYYFPTPAMQPDDRGGVAFAYRRLAAWTGYTVVNHLDADGGTFVEPVLAHGDTDGDSDGIIIGVNGYKTFVAWQYEYENKNMWVNQINNDFPGSLDWTGDKENGVSLAENDMWGFTPVKIIPQTDGWVLFYANSTSYSGATFMVTKIDFEGNTVWTKQIAEDEFQCTGYSIATDGKTAQFFYTCDEEYDDNWNTIPGEGGLRFMSIDITGDGGSATAIDTVQSDDAAVYYNVSGQRLQSAPSAGLYLRQQHGKTVKVVK